MKRGEEEANVVREDGCEKGDIAKACPLPAAKPNLAAVNIDQLPDPSIIVRSMSTQFVFTSNKVTVRSRSQGN